MGYFSPPYSVAVSFRSVPLSLTPSTHQLDKKNTWNALCARSPGLAYLIFIPVSCLSDRQGQLVVKAVC